MWQCIGHNIRGRTLLLHTHTYGMQGWQCIECIGCYIRSRTLLLHNHTYGMQGWQCIGCLLRSRTLLSSSWDMQGWQCIGHMTRGRAHFFSTHWSWSASAMRLVDGLLFRHSCDVSRYLDMYIGAAWVVLLARRREARTSVDMGTIDTELFQAYFTGN